MLSPQVTDSVGGGLYPVRYTTLWYLSVEST